MRVSDENSSMDALLVSAARVLVDAAAEEGEQMNEELLRPDSLDRRVHRAIRSHRRRQQLCAMPVPIKRAIAACMLLCTVSFAFCMSVGAVRAEMWNLMLTWYDNFVQVFYATDAKPPSILKEYREPRLQPASLTREVVTEGATMYRVFYRRGEDAVVTFEQMLLSSSAVGVDDEHGCTTREVKIGSHAGRLFLYDTGSTVLTWHDDAYIYTLISIEAEFDAELLLAMAESVRG